MGNSSEPSGWKIEQAMAAYQSARARLLADDPELNEATLSDMLGAEGCDVMEAIAQLLRAARHAKAQADALSAMIDDMASRKARYLRRNDSMRGTVFAILDALGLAKVEFPDISASIRSGQPSVVITDEASVPDMYVELVRKIDKQTVASVLKSGGEVPGAMLSNSLPTLTLRTR